MPYLYTKSIQLYYKPHDGLSLAQGDADQLPTSVGPLTYYYKVEADGAVQPPPVSNCGLNYFTSPLFSQHPDGVLDLPSPLDADLGPGGSGCQNPRWSIAQIAPLGIKLYFDNQFQNEAAPGKYSANPFPVTNFDPADNEDSIVYSYNPPASVVLHNTNYIWETYSYTDPTGNEVNELQTRLISPVNPVLVNFTGTAGQIYRKWTQSNTPCNFSQPALPLSGVSYFPTEEVPAGATLNEIAAGGIPLMDSNGDILQSIDPIQGFAYYATQGFPSSQNDVTIYNVESFINDYTVNWQASVCTQVVAPNETVREFTVDFANEVEAVEFNTNQFGDFVENSLFCSNAQSLRVFYTNNNTEYDTFFDLVVANEPIYVTPNTLPSNIVPEYWQLINAPEGSYGVTLNSYFFYILEEIDNNFSFGFNGPGWYRIYPFGGTTVYVPSDSAPLSNGFNCALPNRDSNNIKTIVLNYSNSQQGYCEINSSNLSNNQVICQYYSINGQDLTLNEIIQNQIYLYVDSLEYAAYYQIDDLLFTSGYFGDELGFYYNFNSNIAEEGGNPWRGREFVTISDNYSSPFMCTGDGTEIRSLSNLIYVSDIWTQDFPDYNFSDEFCYRQKQSYDLVYYRAHVESPEFTLDEIVQRDIPLTTTEFASGQTLKTNAYSDDTGYYYKWVANEDGTGGHWIGLNSSQTESQAFIANSIQCNIQPIPNYFDALNDNTLTENSGANYLLAFYVFSSCIPVNGQYTHYILFGEHTNQPDNNTSYMSEFTDEIGFNSSFYSVESTDLNYGCKKYVGRIFASSPAQAEELMSSQLDYFQGDIQFVNPSTIGILSESAIYYHIGGCDDCLNNIEGQPGIPYSFPKFDDGNQAEELAPRFGLEQNYNLHNNSKPLLRTNPRLTGNIKLVTDSRGEIYLESINANRDLSDSRYKRYGVSPESDYSYDVSRFFNDNKTPYDMVYETKRRASDLSVLESYDLQFEEDYQYGTRFNNSKLYDENFRIFAPIQIDTNIPKTFVIYRVNSPKPNVNYGDLGADKQDRIKSMLANATIIKTFDLSESSKLGKYIRRHVYNEFFQDSQLTVSFEKNEQTFFKGIDLVKGGFSSKGEFIYKDFVATDKPLIEANDFITDGFKRNRIVASNILNLEFMFDDEEASEYSVSRYFGLFVDEIPSGKGKIQRVNSGLIKFKDLTSFMYYDNHSPSLFDGDTFAIPSSQMMRDIPILGYVKCDTHYHNIKNGSEWSAENYTLRVDDNGDDINRFTGIKDTLTTVELEENVGVGYDFVKLSVTAIPFNGDSISVIENKKQSYCIRVINHIPGSNMTITTSYPSQTTMQINSGATKEEALDNLENQLSISGLLVEREGDVIFVKESHAYFNDINLEVFSSNPAQVIKVEKNYTSSNLFENLITANSAIDKGRCTDREFSNQGNIKDVVVALGGAISKQEGIQTIVNNNDIYVYSNRNIGYARYQHAILVNKSNVVDFVSSLNTDESNDLKIAQAVLDDWNAYYLIGGHSDGRSVLISNDSIGGLNIGDYIDSKKTVGYNKVLDIVENIEDVTSNYSKVVLKTRHDLGKGEFKVFREFEAEIGLFSAYDIYDMNFDFYDMSNSDLKELKYETYQNTNYAPANQAIFNANTGLEEEALDGIIDPDYIKDPELFFAGLNPILYPENPEDQTVSKIDSEYDRLQENGLKEFAVESRVVPNINKWVLKDAKTVRDNPYYLNVNEAFGRTNFSPDITVEGKDPKAFTHEWFYIVNKPEYLKHFMLNDTFSYINYISGFELTKDMFKSIDEDYFTNFMISDGFDVNVDPDEQQIYVVTVSENSNNGYIVYINGEANTMLNMITNNTYYFDLSNVDPTLFAIEGSTGMYQQENIGGVEFGVYTPNIYGFFEFTYDSSQGGNISVSNQDFNKFEAFVKTNRNIKYSVGNGGNDRSFASTIFKGLKFEFKNRKEFDKIKPSEFLKDGTFNDYKFSTVVDYKTGQNRNSIDYEVIKNDAFKFIIFYITVNLDEDYVGNTLNRKLSYLLSNQLNLQEDGEYGVDNVRISGALDLSNIDSNSPGPYIVNGITHFDGSEPNFLTQISPNSDNTYGALNIDYQILDDEGNPLIYQIQIVSIISDSQLVIEGLPFNENGETIDPVYLPLSLQEFAEYVYVGGGVNNHSLLLNKLSINNIVSLINENDPSIKYTTITKEGEIQSNRFVMSIDDGKEIVRASNLIAVADNNKPKSYSLFNGTIGYELQTRNPYYPFLIRHSGKYVCDLKPVVTFTDIYSHFKVNRNYVKNSFLEERNFKDKFYRHPSSQSDEIKSLGPRRVHKAESYYIKYNRTNVAFNLGFISDDGRHDSNWGMIKNHFYHKVNEDNSIGVTKLSESGEASPVYPLIGEIAIDKRDVNVFRSSWEDDYYRTALAGGESSSSPGTFSTKESRSYLSSTVMKLRESYTLTSFTTQNAGTFQNLDLILKNNSHEANVVFAEDSEKVYVDFYMTDLISDVLSVSGVANEIQKYVDAASSFQDKTDLTDDVRSYVNTNLVNLFAVDEVEIYTRRSQSESTSINSVESLDLIDNGGFKLDINYTINQHAQRPINFRLIYNKSQGYSYIIRPMIKIKQ